METRKSAADWMVMGLMRIAAPAVWSLSGNFGRWEEKRWEVMPDRGVFCAYAFAMPLCRLWDGAWVGAKILSFLPSMIFFWSIFSRLLFKASSRTRRKSTISCLCFFHYSFLSEVFNQKKQALSTEMSISKFHPRYVENRYQIPRL